MVIGSSSSDSSSDDELPLPRLKSIIPSVKSIVFPLRNMRGNLTAGNKQEILKNAADLLEKLESENRDLKAVADEAAKDKEMLQILTQQLRDSSTAASKVDTVLIAAGGERVAVNAEFVQARSEYFILALESGMLESKCDAFGLRKVHFNDIDVEVLRIVIEAMHAGELWKGPSCMFSSLDKVCQLVNLSARLLLPDVVRTTAQHALDTSDLVGLLRLLVALVDHDRLFEGCNKWPSLQNQIFAFIGPKIEEACALPEYKKLSVIMVSQIVDGWVDDGPWSREMIVDASSSTVSVCRKIGSHFAKHAFAIGSIGAVQLKYTASWEVLDDDVWVLLWKQIGTEFKATGQSVRLFSRPPPKALQRVAESDNAEELKFRVVSQVSLTASQRRAFAITSYFGNADKPLNERLGVPDSKMRDCLTEYMARSFRLWQKEENIATSLGLSQVESIIASDELRTNGEIKVLALVLQYAMHKKNLPIEAGDEVRTTANFREANLKGSDLIVSSVQGTCIVVTDHEGKVNMEVTCSDLVPREDVCMLRLLPHVRFAFLDLHQVKTQLSEDEYASVSNHDSFRTFVGEALEVQLKKRRADSVGERARKRARYGDFPAVDTITILTNAMFSP